MFRIAKVLISTFRRIIHSLNSFLGGQQNHVFNFFAVNRYDVFHFWSGMTPQDLHNLYFYIFTFYNI